MGTLLLQHNPRLNKNINATGCNFMDLVTMVQLATRYVFHYSEINKLYDMLVSKKIMKHNCLVYDAPQLVREVISSLGIQGATVSLRFIGNEFRLKHRAMWNPNTTSFTILDYNTRSVSTGGHHFMLGNQYGDAIYDPDYGKSQNYVSSFNNWRAWTISTRKLTDKEIKSIKKSKDLPMESVDYDMNKYSMTVTESVPDTIPNTPMEFVLGKDGFTASGGIFEYLATHGGGSVELVI